MTTSTIPGVDDRVTLARQQWEDAFRGLTPGNPPNIEARVLEQMEAVTDELRRRIGGSFTLFELAEAYAESDAWTYNAVAVRASASGWVRTASAATDAAFHLYARGARDYRP